MAIDRGGETTTQLLTLLNVSATRAGKRKWTAEEPKPAPKLNKRRAVQFDDTVERPEPEASTSDATEATKEDGEPKNGTGEYEEIIVLGEDGPDEEGGTLCVTSRVDIR